MTSLEANKAASVKYKTNDLISTMHRLDEGLKSFDAALREIQSAEEACRMKEAIAKREWALLPLHEQTSVRFCELHGTPGRMKA